MMPQALILVLFGFLLVGVAIPLIKRRVKPNGFYGLRVPATFADEWVWYEANAKFGRDMIVYAAYVAVAGCALLFVPEADGSRWVLIVGISIAVGAIIMAAIGWRRANRLLRERRETSEHAR